MFRNYLLTAIRHFTRHKGFALINILCLSIGIVFSLVIIVYVHGERTVNSKLRNAQSQCVLTWHWKNEPTPIEFASFGGMPKALRQEYPNLVAGYFRYNPVTNTVSGNNRHFKEDVAIGDTSLVSMLDFPLL